MTDVGKVFSLSIDEDVRWGVCEIHLRDGAYVENRNHEGITHGRLLNLQNQENVDLHATLRGALIALRDKRQGLMDGVVAVGVSTVGIVNHSKKLLLNFDRHKWRIRSDAKGKYMVDFDSVLREVFSPGVQIEVQNDATAKAMAEYEYSHKAEYNDIFCYANFHHGVNAGYVQKTPLKLPWSAEPVTAAMHQEVGHTCAPSVPFAPKPFDPDHSACPVHKNCFVGLAAGARVIKEWGGLLDEISYDETQLWSPRKEIAFLAAHFIHNVVLNVAPTKIGLAGCVILPDMVEQISAEFTRINTYEGRLYIDYPALQEPDFISMARLTVEQAGVMGGLELARRLFRQSAPTLSLLRNPNV